jgi:hypothetical protein
MMAECFIHRIYKNVSEFTKIAGMGRLALVKNRRLSYL